MATITQTLSQLRSDGPGAGHRSQLAAMTLAAAVAPLAGWCFWALFLRLGPNDFTDYWLAGKLVLEGRSPYDSAALADLARAQGLGLLLGGGYSYPLPFALAMAPFALLPFPAAAAAFGLISMAAFSLTVAWAVGWAVGWSAAAGRRRLVAAFAAGLYPPVYGSLVMGQANLLLVPLMATGAILALDGPTGRARFSGGVLAGLAAIVKLVPAVWAVPLALGRRMGPLAGIAAGVAGAMACALALAPWAAAGSGGLASLFEPDAFYTNQSINGFVTRLVEPSDRTLPILPGAFDPAPAMLLTTAVVAAATLAVLWLRREKLATRRGAAIGLGLALVAGVIGAPKESFWNQAVVLVVVGLLLAVEAPGLDLRCLDRTDRILLGCWFGSAFAWAAVWAVEPPATGPAAALVTISWSISLLGLVGLWWLFARRLLAGQPTAAGTIS